MFPGFKYLVKMFSLFINLVLMYNMTTFYDSVGLRISSFLDKTLTINSEGMLGDEKLFSGAIS